MEVSEENVEQLREMGFMNDVENRRALRLCNNDINNAVNWLLTNNDSSTQSVLSDPLPFSDGRGPLAPTSSDTHTSDVVTELDDSIIEKRDTDAYAAGFPTQNLFELEGRVFTENWSIPYKRNESLGRCLVAATQFASVNFLDADPDSARFVQRFLPECFRKLLSTSAVLGWQGETLDGIIDMLELLGELVAKRLRYLPVQHDLLGVLALAFRTDTEYQSKSRTRRPRDRSEWLTQLRSALTSSDKPSAADKSASSSSGTQAISDVFAYTPSQYRDPYGVLVNLINEFAAHGGFGALQSILLQTIASGSGTQGETSTAPAAQACGSVWATSSATRASIFDLSILIAPFANCFEFLTPFAVREYIAPLVTFAHSLVATPSSARSGANSSSSSSSSPPTDLKLNVSVLEHALKDKKAHLVFDLLRTLKLVALKLRAAPNDLQAAFAAVGDVRTLVECNFDRLRLDLCLLMLRSEHFNARMNTLKELERFIDVLQNGGRSNGGASGSTSASSSSGTSSAATSGGGVVLTGVALNLAVSSLERVAQISASEFEAWLAEHRVIELLILEGNLDQQQYLDKIKTVVEYMSTRLSVGEIEQIWSLQFQTQSMLDNVFSLLAIAAAKFSETQFDHLYSLIQRSWLASSAPSASVAASSLDFEYDFQLKEKLILMLSKIARETKDSKIVLKLLQILWDLAFVHTRPLSTCASDSKSDEQAADSAAPDGDRDRPACGGCGVVAKRRAFLERLILLILNEHLAVLNESNSVREATRRTYALKCIDNIKTGAHYVAASINQLIQIMRSIAKTAFKPEKTVLQEMNNQHEIVRMVINSLIKLVKELDSPNMRIAPDLIVDGLCTLFDSLKIHLEFLRYVLKEGELYLTCMRATELFDCLILRFHSPPAASLGRNAAPEGGPASASASDSAPAQPSVTRPDSLQIGNVPGKPDGPAAQKQVGASKFPSSGVPAKTDFIQDLAADWFRVSISDLEGETQTTLFKKNFAALNHSQLTVKGFLMFRDYFEKVNIHAKKLRQAIASGPLATGASPFNSGNALGSGSGSAASCNSDQSSAKFVVERTDLLGVDFCWQLALNTDNMTVARGAVQLLLNINFNCLAPRLRRASTDLHARFIHECEQRMLQEASFRKLAAATRLGLSLKSDAAAVINKVEPSSPGSCETGAGGALERAVRSATVCLVAALGGSPSLASANDAGVGGANADEAADGGSLTRIERLLLIVEQYVARVEDDFETSYARENNAPSDSVFTRRFPPHTVTFFGLPFSLRFHVAHDSGSPTSATSNPSAYSSSATAGNGNGSSNGQTSASASSLHRYAAQSGEVSANRCEFVLQCHTNDTVSSLYRRVAAHLRVPVAAVQLSFGNTQTKERYASGGSSTLQRDKSSKDRPLPNCKSNRLLIEALALGTARSRPPLLNVRVTPSVSMTMSAAGAGAGAASASASAAPVGGFYSLELEKQMPSVLIVQDSNMFELLFELVALQHSGVLRNLHRLIRRLPSDPAVYRQVFSLLDSLVSSNPTPAAMDVDGDSGESLRHSAFYGYMKTLLDAKSLSLFHLAHNLETISAVLMPAVNLPGLVDSPLGAASGADLCNADLFTVSDVFARVFVEAGCVELLVHLLEFDWLTERGFRKSPTASWTQQRTEYELLLQVFVITMQLLRFLLVGQTPLQSLNFLADAVDRHPDEQLPHPHPKALPQVRMSKNNWSHLFTVLLRLAWHTALRGTVLISADEKASQSPTSGSAMQHAEVANSGVSTRVVQFSGSVFATHRSREHFDAAYFHKLISMHALSLLLGVVVQRNRVCRVEAAEPTGPADLNDVDAASLLRILYNVPCLSQWLLQLLVECPNAEIRAFIASSLFEFCTAYDHLAAADSQDASASVQQPKHFLLKLLLTAHLPFWNTTLMLRSREKQRLLAQCYDYFSLRANLLAGLSKREQTLLNVTCAQLLKDECDWLVNFLPGIPNSLDASPGDVPAHGIVLDGSKFLNVEECLLSGHLEVLHALLTCESAEKRATGERLIATLLTDCLFPAGALLHTAEQLLAQRDLGEKNSVERERALIDALQSLLPPSHGSSSQSCTPHNNNALHLLPKARSSLARSRCLLVIEELCRDCVENLECATRCLLELHHTVDRRLLDALPAASGDSALRMMAQFDMTEPYTDWEYSFLMQERNTRSVATDAAKTDVSNACSDAAAAADDDATTSKSTCDNLIGLRNGGATCYMNSILQQLYMQPGVCEYLLQINTDLLDDGNILLQVQQLFAYLKHALFEYYAPRQFWHHFRWNYSMTQSINIREQQDAYDFLTSLIDQLDLQLEKLHRDEIFKLHYQGSFTDLKECEGGCSHRFEREQDFYGLNLSVKTGSLLDALKEFVQVETLEGANAYYCEHCHEKRRTRKRMLISKLPEVLTVQLKRFDYDWDAQKPVKFNDYFAFPFCLNMKPFTTASLAAPAANASAGAAAAAAAAACAGAATVTEDDDPEFAYELVGIVIHSGVQANAGHYYSFIKDRRGGSRDANPHYGRWYKFNDTTVEQFDAFDEARAALAGPGYIDPALEHECYGGLFKQTFAAPPPPPTVNRDSVVVTAQSDGTFKRPRDDNLQRGGDDVVNAATDFDDELHDLVTRYEENNSLIQNIFKNASLSSFALSNYAQPGSMTSLSLSTSSVTSQSSSFSDERTRYWNAYLLFYERVLKRPPTGAALHPVLTPSKRKSSVALVTPYQGQFGSLSALPQHPFGSTPPSAPPTHRYSSVSLATGGLTPSGAAARRLFVPSNSALASPHTGQPPNVVPFSNAGPSPPPPAHQTPPVHHSHTSPLSAARARSMSTSTMPNTNEPGAGTSQQQQQPTPTPASVQQPRGSRNSSSFVELTRLVSLSEDNELGLSGAYAHHALGSTATTPFADNISILGVGSQQMLHPFEVRALFTPYHRWSQIASKRIRLQLLLDNLLFFKQRAIYSREYFRFARLLVLSNVNRTVSEQQQQAVEDRPARIACEFALQFLTNAFYRVHRRLRDGELDNWKQLLHNLLQCSSSACSFAIDYLVSQSSVGSASSQTTNAPLTVVIPTGATPNQLISTLLLRCPQQQVRSHMGAFLENLLLTAAFTHRLEASVDRLVAAYLEALENGELAANVTRCSAYFLVLYNFVTSPPNEEARLDSVRLLTRHSTFSRLAQFLIGASTGQLANANTPTPSVGVTGTLSPTPGAASASEPAPLTQSQSAMTLRKAMSRDQIREFNGYLFAVLSQLLSAYDCSSTPNGDPSSLVSRTLRVDQLDSLASRWLGASVSPQMHSLLVEALLFAREHYCSTANASTAIGASFPVSMQTVAVQLLDALAFVSAQNRRFAEELIAVTLQQLDAVAAVADINTLLHVLELEVSLTEESAGVGVDGCNKMDITVGDDAEKPPSLTPTPWRVLAIVDGRLESAASGEAEATRRISGLLQIIQSEHERDTRKAYLCIKFLVQQAQRCDAIRFYLTHPADRWEWCCNWLRNLMSNGLDGVTEARRNATAGSSTAPTTTSTVSTSTSSSTGTGTSSTAVVPYREPNGTTATPALIGPQPLSRSINYGTFQRTVSATVTLQSAMDMMNASEASDTVSEKLEPIKQDDSNN